MFHSAEATSRGKCRLISFARSAWRRHVKTNQLPSLALSPTHISYKEKKRAMSSSVTLPKQVPVMPLPGALLFPHALLPLHIFEPPYREMLKGALREHRMFSVALIRPQRNQWKSTEDFFDVAGVGLIRACVGRSDGTSNLILQGLRRVRFTSFEQETPFPIARIDIVESCDATTVETEALGAKVLELYANLKHDRRQLPAKVDRYLP